MCDFGLSRFRDLNMTAFVGTRLWGASELVCENYAKAVYADVVAYGMSLFRVFSDSMAEKNLSKRKARFARVPEIPDFLCNVITSCWSGKAEERQSFVAIVNSLPGHVNSLGG